MKVFSYVICTDDSGAPNYDPPRTTLALCKPKIRRCAQPGDLVLGFCGQTLGPEPHAVRWAGVVSEKMTFAEYWKDFRYAGKKPAKSESTAKGTKPDNIYRPVGDGYEQVPNAKHPPKEQRKDLSGRYVLAFKPSWYFGPAMAILPKEFGLHVIARRAGRVREIDDSTWRQLQKWLDKNCPSKPTLPNKPRHRRTC